MILATTIIAIGVFTATLWRLGITTVAADVLGLTRSVLVTVRNDAVDDFERERVVRRAALRMFSMFVSIVTRSLLAIAASFAPIGAAHLAGVVDAAEVLSFLSRWEVVLTATAIMIAGYAGKERLWPPSHTTPS